MNEPIKITKLEFNSSALNSGLKVFQEETNNKLKLEEESVCKAILTQAKMMCPVNTGALRDSGFIEKTDTGYKVGFSAPYAKIVHEKPDGWQKSGETQFLAKAIKEVCGEDYGKLKRRLMGSE